MKKFLLLLIFIGATHLMGQRLNHHPRVRIETDFTTANQILQPAKPKSPAPGQNNHLNHHNKFHPTAILKTSEEIDDPWNWILFILFFICVVAALIAITLGFAAPNTLLFIIFTIVAAASFAAGMTMLVIVLANMAPDPLPSLLEK